MQSLFQSLLLLLAQATDRALARQVQYLKAENEILRSKLPKRVTVAPKERLWLLRFGKPLGSAIKHLISIASPRTFFRWLQATGENHPNPSRPTGSQAGRGRPRRSASWCCA